MPRACGLGSPASACSAVNIESREQLRALTDAIRAANPRAVIAIDEEGGDVTRLYADEGSPYPGNALLGRIDDLELTAEVAATVARELRSVGVNLNFAPDVDINSNPDNPVIGVRSFGDDPHAVAAHAAAWVAAHEAEGVAVSAKHFPGHGDTAQDSHLALPVVDLSLETLRERELVPFVAAIAAGARTHHDLAHRAARSSTRPRRRPSRRPSSKSLLREELGFEGVIVSDALDMAGASGEIGIPAAAVRAIAAGCDLLCIGTRNTDEQLAAIEAALDAAIADGTLPADRLAEAAARVAALAALRRRTRAELGTSSVRSFDVERAIDAFEVQPRTRHRAGRDARHARDRREHRGRSPRRGDPRRPAPRRPRSSTATPIPDAGGPAHPGRQGQPPARLDPRVHRSRPDPRARRPSSSTWAGRRPTGPTRTSPRSAHPGSRGRPS